MVTSINGNNVTWKDNKTGELITDPHNDLELMMQKGRKINRKRKQNGGNFRPKGLVQKGSGRIDPTSRYNLPVDDVEALIGFGEYVVNKNAVDAVGEEFLDNLNSIGIGNPSNIPRGTGKYGGYQRGGKVKPKPVRKQRGGRGRKRLRRQTGGSNGQCGPNQHWMPPANGQPGYCMGGKTHPTGGMYQGGGRKKPNIGRQRGTDVGRKSSMRYGAKRGMGLVVGTRARDVVGTIGFYQHPFYRSCSLNGYWDGWDGIRYQCDCYNYGGGGTCDWLVTGDCGYADEAACLSAGHDVCVLNNGCFLAQEDDPSSWSYICGANDNVCGPNEMPVGYTNVNMVAANRICQYHYSVDALSIDSDCAGGIWGTGDVGSWADSYPDPPNGNCSSSAEDNWLKSISCGAEGTDEIWGCTDASACNFNEDANIDDGSCTYAEQNYDCNGNCIDEAACNYGAGSLCEYPEQNYDCNGNCTTGTDCLGNCGGNATYDGCGICNYTETLECGCTLDSQCNEPEEYCCKDYCGTASAVCKCNANYSASGHADAGFCRLYSDGRLPRQKIIKQKGGRTIPVRRQRGGRGRKRFQGGGHSHDFNHSHAVLTSPDYLLESEFTDMWTGDLIEGTAVMGGAHPRGAGQSVLSGNGNGKINNRLRRQTGNGGYVFASTGLSYHGPTVEVGGALYTTTGKTKVATSQKVILKNDYNKNRPK